MYWLYFARDFYRTGTSASDALRGQAAAMPKATSPEQPAPLSPAHTVTEPTLATHQEIVPQPTPMPTKRAAKRQAEFVVKSELETHPIPAAAPSHHAYLQRLSIDGEHAFGVWDEEAGFSMFSANFERVTGLMSGECAGHEWIHFIHHTQQYAVNEALLSAIEGQDGSCLVQVRRLKEEAETRWLMLDIKAATPRQPGIMVLLRDLTEQKALELALAETESALALSDRSRAAFLSSMSHELRTPLNAIMGFSEMMKSGVFGELGNPTYKEYAKHIHDSGSHLLGKINDLLDIASMDVGGLQLDETEFNLYGMLNEAIEMHTHQAFARQQAIRLDCAASIELSGDRAKLMCAMSHLLTNALRHSAEDSEVTLSVRTQPDDTLVLSVRDAGEGISHGQLDIIRSALAAEVSYFNIESGGIGLGLSLTKELAQRHGGRVMIDSLRHRGTVVSMILPISRVVSGLPKAKRRSQ